MKRYWLVLQIIFLVFASRAANASNWFPEDASCNSLALHADLLYWVASGTELDFASENNTKVSAETGTVRNQLNAGRESLHAFKFNWRAGYRLGFAAPVACSEWLIEGDWTHYSTSDSGKLARAFNSQTQDLFVSSPYDADSATAGVGAPTAIDIQSHLKFRWNRVTLEAGHWFTPCGSFSFKPHAGFDFSMTQENLHWNRRLNISVGQQSGIPIPLTTILNHSIHTNYLGYGLRAGLTAAYSICDWDFFADGSVAGYYGNFRVNRTTTETSEVASFFSPNVSATNAETKFHYQNWQGRLITDLSVGVRYNFCICDFYPTQLMILWEQHYFFDQTDFRFHNHSDIEQLLKPAGNFSLQGVTFVFGVEF